MTRPRRNIYYWIDTPPGCGFVRSANHAASSHATAHTIAGAMRWARRMGPGAVIVRIRANQRRIVREWVYPGPLVGKPRWWTP